MKHNDLSTFDSNEFKAEGLTQLKSGQPLTGKDGILTPLIKSLLESALEGEMDAHLDVCQEGGISNHRNRKTTKIMKAALGPFEPEIVKKRQTVLNESWIIRSWRCMLWA